MNQLRIAMAQMLWDRGQPNGYSHHVTSNNLPGVNAKEVVMRVAIGDHQVTTFAGHIMARTMGAEHLTSGLGDVWELDPVTSTESGSFYVELDEFLRNGTGTNHCAPGDADEHQVTSLGVCSYPTLSGCNEDETDAQDLCIPGEAP